MIKNILLTTLFLLYSSITHSSNIDMKTLDAQSRVQSPNTNSIMFRRNAEQYKMLSDKDKAEFLKIDTPLIIYKEDGEYTDEILKIYDKKR